MGVDLIKRNRIFFLDGAMGTMLQRAGIKADEIPETYNIIHPEVIADIHRKYIEAGADIITTNTFGANEFKLKNCKYTVEEIITSAVSIARKEAVNALVALDIGPTGQLLEPMGELSFQKAYEVFTRQVRAGVKAGADLILIETMSDIYEAKAAILASKENSNLPVFCTMTFEKNGRTLTGTDPLTMVNILQGLGVEALGVNCSVGPMEMIETVKQLLSYSKVPVIVQPNAGMPRVCCNQITYDITPDEFASCMKEMAAMGAAFLGGCCGTSPEYIKRTVELVKGTVPKEIQVKPITAASSSRKTVVLGQETKVIGERINPTGKSGLIEALKERDMDYLVNEAIEQKEAGADILDVNVGISEIDEKILMTEAISEIQSFVDLPLQIDSMRAEVIEAAVRICNGKPIINSVNGGQESMHKIFPIAKKYGACVIGLTLDEDGIPKTAERRYEIAVRIIECAESFGILKEDIIIDCLTLTASSKEDAMETLKALRMVKEKLGVATTLGISNISFGLPNRKLLNRTFLAMALEAGLDAPILNPLDDGVIETVDAFKLLSKQDTEMKNYIGKYGI